jgi:hypothetical protein
MDRESNPEDFKAVRIVFESDENYTLHKASIEKKIEEQKDEEL